MTCWLSKEFAAIFDDGWWRLPYSSTVGKLCCFESAYSLLEVAHFIFGFLMVINIFMMLGSFRPTIVLHVQSRIKEAQRFNISARSEERRVGKECRSRWSP